MKMAASILKARTEIICIVVQAQAWGSEKRQYEYFRGND